MACLALYGAPEALGRWRRGGWWGTLQVTVGQGSVGCQTLTLPSFRFPLPFPSHIIVSLPHLLTFLSPRPSFHLPSPQPFSTKQCCMSHVALPFPPLFRFLFPKQHRCVLDVESLMLPLTFLRISPFLSSELGECCMSHAAPAFPFTSPPPIPALQRLSLTATTSGPHTSSGVHALV